MKFLQQTKSAFNVYASPKIALAMEAYMKNKFKFLGIPRPQRDAVQKELFPILEINDANDLETVIKSLWKLPYREYHYFAMDILTKNKKLVKDLSFDFFNYLIETNSWWDSVDTICSKGLGPYYEFHKGKYKKDMKVWWTSDNFWKRRACIIFQLNYKENTDLDFLSKRILENNTSNEFFLQKAIGWSLRQYAKTNSNWVEEFLENNELKPLSRREARKIIDA